MYENLIKNYNKTTIHEYPRSNFINDQKPFTVEYELKNEADIVGYCEVVYASLKKETILELLELKKGEKPQYLNTQFRFDEIDKSYTGDKPIENDYQAKLKREIEVLENFLKRYEIEKRLSNLEKQRLIYSNEKEQIDDPEVIETNIVNIDAEMADLNSRLIEYSSKYPLLDENMKEIFLNNIHKLKTLKREQTKYYDENRNTTYIEVFQHKEAEVFAPEESGISKLTNLKRKTIGYRYYRNGINNSPIDSNNFVTIVEYSDGQYHPIQDTGSYEGDLEIIHSIFREHYKGKTSYDITGNPQKRVGSLAIIKTKSKQSDSPFVFISKDITVTKDITVNPVRNYVSKKDIDEYLKQAKDCGKTVVIPVVISNHRSTLFLEPSGKMSLFDTSTVHLTKEKQPDPKIFDEYSGKIEVLNTENIQCSGCCCFFSDSLCEVIADPKNGFSSVEDIKKGIIDGSLQLKMSAKMCNIFDEDPNLPTVKMSGKIDDIDEEKYLIKKIKGVYYGINKDIFNPHGNKFLLLKGLVNCFKDEGVIEEFENFANAQNECYLLENFVIKPIKERILTLERHSNFDEDNVYSIFDGEDGENFYYDTIYNKTDIEKSNTRQEYLKSLNVILQETLDEKQHIINNEPMENIKDRLMPKRREIIDFVKELPEYKYILRTKSTEVSDIPKIQMNEIDKPKIIPKKIKQKSPGQPPLSFVQRENLKRQQRERSGSAPARLGY